MSISTGIAQAEVDPQWRVRAVPDFPGPVLLEPRGQARIDNNKPLMTGCSPFMGMSRNRDRYHRATADRARGDFAGPPTKASVIRRMARRNRAVGRSLCGDRPGPAIDPGPNPNSCWCGPTASRSTMDRLEGEEPAPRRSRRCRLKSSALAVVNQFHRPAAAGPPLPGPRVAQTCRPSSPATTTLRQIYARRPAPMEMPG